MRTAASLALVAGLLATLAACSATPNGSAAADCTPTPSGTVSDAVTVTGDFGKKPTVKINFPTTTDTTQRTVVIQGKGDVAQAKDVVNVDFTLYNGATGAELTSTQYAEGSTTSFPVDESQFLPGIVKTLECSQVGSRVVGVIPPADSFGEAGSSQLGVDPGQDIVFVVDVVSIAPPAEAPLSAPDGADQPATAGFPDVVVGADGSPAVTIPDTAPPATLQMALLKKGDHAVVKDGDKVIVNYVGVNWNTKKIFDSSFARGETATFSTSQVIAGFTAALVGQNVGSRVIVVIPPDQGYGAAGSPPDIGPTDTLVFVIDILGIA
ncbi:MAG: Peptidylprolyl isomerase [Rhodoglobus sp.]|nr:Peptidylprolyl isomerase [Rhodoglobus sp.]